MSQRKILFLLAFLIPVHGEIFYACNGGDGSNPKADACSGAWDISHLNDARNWASLDATDRKIGPGDTVYFKDDGGWFRNGLIIQGSGVSGKPITFKAATGDNPVIVASERYTGSDWILWYNSGGKKIYRLHLIRNNAEGFWSFWPVASHDNGRTWFLPKMVARDKGWGVTDIQNSMEDGYYISLNDKSHNYVYYRKDDGNVPGIWELGYRPFAVNLKDRTPSHIVWDNIDVFGPAGCNDRFAGAWPCDSNPKNIHMMVAQNNKHLTIQNTEISHGGFVAFGVLGSGSADTITIDDCDIHDVAFATHFKGYYANHVQGSQGMKNVLVHNSRIYNVGARAEESGDREPVGFLGVDGGIIRNNYIGTQLHDREGEVNWRSNQIAIVGCRDIIIENNYLFDAGLTHLDSGGGSAELTNKNMIIRNNVFDTHGFSIFDGLGDDARGVQVGCCRNRNDVIRDCDTNYPQLGDACYDDDLGEVYITNNLFMNSVNVMGWELSDSAYQDHFWAALSIRGDYYDKLVIANNIFYKNPMYHEMMLSPHYTTRKSDVFIENNIFFSDAASDWSGEVIKYNTDNPGWDRSHITAEAPGNFNYDMRNTYGFPNVRNNVMIDPMIISSQGGVNFSKALKAGSNAIDAGKNLGVDFARGFNPATDFLGKIQTVDQNSFGSWEIGPFVYTGEASCVPVVTCSSWSAWSSCVNSQQTRTRTCTNSCSQPSIETQTLQCSINLISHWGFDESGIQAIDQAGDNDGIITGATRVIGIKGNALFFDGLDDMIVVQDSSSLNPSQITAAFWFRPEATTSSQGFIAKGDSTHRQYWAWIHDGSLSLEADEGSYLNYIFPVTVNRWHHYAFTFDGSVLKAYVNGNLVKEAMQATGPIDIDNDPLYIGTLPGFQSFKGAIDEVRLYDGPLSGQQIMQIYASERCLSTVRMHEIIHAWRTGQIALSGLIESIERWKSCF